jgi:hypothetical protein
MLVLVDVKAGVVQIGSKSLSGQWVDLYALLALAAVDGSAAGPHVTAEALARTGPWRHKAIPSVGKEVARHLAWLSRNGLEGVLGSYGRTRSWRLRLEPESIRFVPDREGVQAWVLARTQTITCDKGWLDGLRALIDATAELSRGRAEQVLDILGAADATPERLGSSEPALRAWGALLTGRALAQADEDDALHVLIEEWSARADAASRAVSARLRAVAAFRHRFSDPSATMASLVKLAAELELCGEIGSLAVIVNVMGLLARRAGQPEVGMAHHLRAAALSGIVGDYPQLQGAVFNMSICLREILRREGRPPDKQILALVDMTRFICAKFGVGGDSAQAETAGAEWSVEMGDAARARTYLAEAEGLIKTLESTFDQAYFLEVRAAVELFDPTGESDPAQDLRASARLYEDARDNASAARVARAHRRLQWRSKPPSRGVGRAAGLIQGSSGAPSIRAPRTR